MAEDTHSLITEDDELHIPKGFTEAINSSVLSKDVSGNLEWVTKNDIGGSVGPQGPPGDPISETTVSDINDPTELNALDDTNGTLRRIIKVSSLNDISSLYYWDSSSSVPENPPFSVDGNGGMWILISTSWMPQLMNLVNGYFLEEIRVIITSNGTVVTLTLDKKDGGDLTIIESGVHLPLDTTPALTIALTLGSDTSPILNYIYIENKILTKSTTGFPSSIHEKIGTFLVQSATGAQADGLYKAHIHSNIVSEEIEHLSSWVRKQHTTWESGVGLTSSVGVDLFDIATTAGIVSQLHEHVFAAFDTSVSDVVFVINDSSTPFNKVSDLTNILTDSLGVTMSNRRFNLIIWGIESNGESKLMVNLPSGSYGNDIDAIDDVNSFNNFIIASEFKGTAFLISRLTVRHQSGPNSWSILQNEDLRGQLPSIFVGGITGATTIFADNAFEVFDESDTTKRFNFQCSGITTGNTRVQSIPDENGIIAHRNNDNIFSTNQTFANNVEVRGQVHSPTNNLTDDTTIATDMNLGNVHTVTLEANRTLGAPTNLKNGGVYSWIIKQDGTGSKTLAYNSVFKFEGGSAPTLSTGANEIDILSAISNGTDLYAKLTKNFS